MRLAGGFGTQAEQCLSFGELECLVLILAIILTSAEDDQVDTKNDV